MAWIGALCPSGQSVFFVAYSNEIPFCLPGARALGRPIRKFGGSRHKMKSLGAILALALAGLQLLAIAVVVFSSYFTSERTLLEHARTQMVDVGTNVIQHAKWFMSPARSAAELSTALASNQIVRREERQHLEGLLFQQLRSAPQFAGAYYGDEEGNFVYVKRDGTQRFVTKIIDAAAGQDERTQFIQRREDFIALGQRFDPDDRYDPRKRPWYQKAKVDRGSIWTDPYIFFTSQSPGITAATPVIGFDDQVQGVVGVDIEIAELSSFLSQLRVGQNGAAFILNRNGDVIAHPNPALLTTQTQDGGLSFPSIAMIDDPIARAAFGDRLTGGGIAIDGLIQANFEHLGEQFVSLIMPFGLDDIPWTIVLYAPENDFIGTIKANRFQNTLIAVGVAAMTALLGLALAELVGRAFQSLLSADDKDTLTEFVERIAEHTAFGFEAKAIKKDGDPVWISFNGIFFQASTQGETYIVATIDDITQTRASEEKIETLNREIAHFSRQEMMGELATGLAHELNQPLTAITQNVDAAQYFLGNAPEKVSDVQGLLGEIDQQAHQAADIIRALRSLVRKDENIPDTFDIRELMLQSRRLVRSEARQHGIDIVVKRGSEIVVRAVRVQIAQVVVNLLRNAIEALAESDTNTRKISISASQTDTCVRICVEDAGPGVADSLQLFTAFETTKRDGMGLGLSISKTLIEANGGEIWHEPGTTGARFIFTLPLGGQSDG